MNLPVRHLEYFFFRWVVLPVIPHRLDWAKQTIAVENNRRVLNAMTCCKSLAGCVRRWRRIFWLRGIYSGIPKIQQIAPRWAHCIKPYFSECYLRRPWIDVQLNNWPVRSWKVICVAWSTDISPKTGSWVDNRIDVFWENKWYSLDNWTTRIAG